MAAGRGKLKLIIQVIMPDGKYLTVDEFRKMWKTELLPSIRQEVKLEIETLNANIKVLTDRCSPDRTFSTVSVRY